MKVLVTGAAGFIGQHVVRLLRERKNHSVIALDTSRHHLVDLNWDITEPLSPIRDLDAIIHLAAIAAPNDCDRNPGQAFNVNVNGTHQVLKMALESKVKRVVFSSTAHVYGISPRYFPTDENHPLWLQNNYTLTKIIGEQLCQLYYENHGISYTALRLFNAYGPGQMPGYFIPDMIEKSKKGGFTLNGGNTTKDWVYIEDVARAFVRALDSDFVGPINIGTGVETRLGKIAAEIARASDQMFSESYEGDNGATRMCADASRAMRVLSWQAETKLEEGLRATLAAAGIRPVVSQPQDT